MFTSNINPRSMVLALALSGLFGSVANADSPKATPANASSTKGCRNDSLRMRTDVVSAAGRLTATLISTNALVIQPRQTPLVLLVRAAQLLPADQLPRDISPDQRRCRTERRGDW